jgi:hypothetical protein
MLMATFDEWRPGNRLIATMRACGLDEWHPGDLLIEVLRFCGLVALAGGVLLALLGLLGGAPDRLYETRFNLDLIDEGVAYALLGAALTRPVGCSAACSGGVRAADQQSAAVAWCQGPSEPEQTLANEGGA